MHEQHTEANTTEAKLARKKLWKRIKITLGLACVGAVILLGVVVVLLRSDPKAVREQRTLLKLTSPRKLEAMAADVEARLFGLGGGLESGGKTTSQTTSDPSVVESSPGAPAGWLEPGGGSKDSGRGPGKTTGEKKGAQSVGPEPAGEPKPDNLPKIGSVHTVHLEVQEINAWLSARLKDWLEYRDIVLPKQVSQPVFAIDDGHMIMAFEVTVADFSQSFNAKFDLKFQDDGYAKLILKNVKAGQLPIPAEQIGRHLADQAPQNQQIQKIASWLDKLQNYRFKPVMKMRGKRKVRLTNYRLSDKGMDITIKIEDRRPKPPRLVAATAKQNP